MGRFSGDKHYEYVKKHDPQAFGDICAFASTFGGPYEDLSIATRYQVESYVLDRHAAFLHLKERYEELIYAVGKTMPGKSRHEVALFYIQKAESSEQIGGPVDAEPIP